MNDWTFFVAVLETPLGPSPEWDTDNPVAVERAKILARYETLRGRLSMGAASRQARVEWLRDRLAARPCAEDVPLSVDPDDYPLHGQAP